MEDAPQYPTELLDICCETDIISFVNSVPLLLQDNNETLYDKFLFYLWNPMQLFKYQDNNTITKIWKYNNIYFICYYDSQIKSLVKIIPNKINNTQYSVSLIIDNNVKYLFKADSMLPNNTRITSNECNNAENKYYISQYYLYRGGVSMNEHFCYTSKTLKISFCNEDDIVIYRMLFKKDTPIKLWISTLICDQSEMNNIDKLQNIIKKFGEEKTERLFIKPELISGDGIIIHVYYTSQDYYKFTWNKSFDNPKLNIIEF